MTQNVVNNAWPNW